MPTHSVSKYLSYNLLKTFAITCVLNFIAFQISNKGYRTFEQKQGDALDVFFSVFWTIVLVISAFTVYFNLTKRVRDAPLLCFLSFFFMPVFVSIVTFCIADQDSQWILFFINTSIFLLVHAFFYIQFLALLKKDTISENNKIAYK